MRTKIHIRLVELTNVRLAVAKIATMINIDILSLPLSKFRQISFYYQSLNRTLCLLVVSDSKTTEEHLKLAQEMEKIWVAGNKGFISVGVPVVNILPDETAEFRTEVIHEIK